MIDEALNDLKDGILSFIGNDKFDGAYYASFVYSEQGEFIVCENYDDSKRLNFDDSLGRYFYVRLLEPAKSEFSAIGSSSCYFNFDLIIPVRLVIYVPKGIADNLVTLFHNALAMYSKNRASVSSYTVETNKYAVFNKETAEQSFDGIENFAFDLDDKTIIAFDFMLNFTVKTQPKKCLELPICEC